MVATCTKCNVTKSKELFFKRKDRPKGILSRCKECLKGRSKNFYTKNQKAILEQKRQRKNKRELVEFFGNECLDCHQNFPMCVYDFHHLDPSQKEGNNSLTQKRKERIEQEKENCVLLCANCHRLRHWTPPSENKSTD